MVCTGISAFGVLCILCRPRIHIIACYILKDTGVTKLAKSKEVKVKKNLAVKSAITSNERQKISMYFTFY